MPRLTGFMARRMRASSGGSSHNGGGKPSRIGGMIGVRKSFFQQYFSSRRSATQGGTGIGVNRPIEKGQQPLKPNGASANRPSTRVRIFLIPLPPSCARTAGVGRHTGHVPSTGYAASMLANKPLSLLHAGSIGQLCQTTLTVRRIVSRRGVGERIFALPPASPFRLRLGDLLLIGIGGGTEILSATKFHQRLMGSGADLFFIIAEQINQLAAQAWHLGSDNARGRLAQLHQLMVELFLDGRLTLARQMTVEQITAQFLDLLVVAGGSVSEGRSHFLPPAFFQLDEESTQARSPFDAGGLGQLRNTHDLR